MFEAAGTHVQRTLGKTVKELLRVGQLGSNEGTKGKVPGRSARTFLTIEDPEHSAKELGFFSVQRRPGGAAGLVVDSHDSP